MTISDIIIVALTLFGECRGESLDGKLAVASVIWTRSQERHLPMREVCLQYKQFSCWEDADLIDKTTTERMAWLECLAIAKDMAHGRFAPINNWNHYYNPNVANPSWGGSMVNAEVIGNHRFGRCA